MNKIVITLSTVPERLLNNHPDGFKKVINSLCTQAYDNYEVHINIPEIYKVTNEPYIIPNWLVEYQSLHPTLHIYRCEDNGAVTKLAPTIARVIDPEYIIVVVDDDLIYHQDMLREHIKYQEMFKDSVILYDGRGLVKPKYGDLRDAWILSVAEVLQVKSLQHYKSVSYRRRYFDDTFFTDFLGKTKNDDILLSCYLNSKNIPMLVVPYELDISSVDTLDKWKTFSGVATFPVLAHAHSISKTGCHDPAFLTQEPTFFCVPPELKQYQR